MNIRIGETRMGLKNNSENKADTIEHEGFLYEAIFKEATDAIFIGDKYGNFLNTNIAAELLTGYSKAELSKMKMSDLFLEKVLEQKPLNYEEVLAREIVVMRREIKRKNGSLVFVEMKSKMLSNGNLISFFSDLTAEKKLFDTEIKYKEIVENVKEGIVILKGEKVIFANPITGDMLGYPLDEIIDQPFLNFVYPDDRMLIQRNHVARLKGDSSILKSYEFRMLTKTGKALWVETNPIVIEHEGENVVQAFLVDISEKKKAQIALELSEIKNRTIIENSFEGILVMRDFKLLFYNNSLIELLKLDTKSNLINFDLTKVIHPVDLKKTMDFYQKRLKGINVPSQYPIRVFTTQNEMLWVELKAVIIDWLGEPASLVFLTDITAIKKTEEALQQSEKKFRYLVENMKEGVVSINSDFQITYASPGLAKILNYPVDELVGKNFVQFVFNEDIYYAKRQFSKAIEEKPEPTELRVITKTGEIIWLKISGKPLFENNKVVGMSAVIIDINSRKKVEDNLKRSERKYRNLIDNSPVGILIYDQGKIIYMNNALKTMAGFKILSDVTGKSVFQFIPNEYHNMIKQRAQTIMKTKGKAGLAEAKIISQSGKLIDVLFLGQYILFEGNPCIQTYVYDITEFNKYKTDVDKLSQAVEQSSSAIFINDYSGIVEYVNQSFEKLTGLTFDEIKEGNESIFKMLNVKKEDTAKISKAATTGKPWFGELSIKRKNGEIIDVHVVISPIINKLGEITHFVSIAENLTAEKEIKNNLKFAKEMAEKSDRLKSNFLAQMSHEIRTPINAIVSFTGLLKAELFENLDDDQRISFEMIERAGDRIIRTIELLLNYSELQSKSYEPIYNRIEIGSEILSKYALKYRQQAKSKNINFIVNIETENSFFYGDRYAIDQIFSNLIDNAIKYTNKGGVEVKLFNNENEKLTAVISDTGIGIAKNYVGNIFNPFSQEETGYTRSFEGNGLGLAIVKEYCEMDNIKISVESTKNIGTTFTLTF